MSTKKETPKSEVKIKDLKPAKTVKGGHGVKPKAN
jgi:hypothetical protein